MSKFTWEINSAGGSLMMGVVTSSNFGARPTLETIHSHFSLSYYFTTYISDLVAILIATDTGEQLF